MLGKYTGLIQIKHVWFLETECSTGFVTVCIPVHIVMSRLWRHCTQWRHDRPQYVTVCAVTSLKAQWRPGRQLHHSTHNDVTNRQWDMNTWDHVVRTDLWVVQRQVSPHNTHSLNHYNYIITITSSNNATYHTQSESLQLHHLTIYMSSIAADSAVN